MPFDKKIIAQNFSKKANFYDKNAEIQTIAASRICKIGQNFIKPDSVILDLGSGTSFIAKNFCTNQIYELDLSQEMLNQWHNRPKNIFPILGDIENPPFPDQSFDIIISCFALQWVNDLNKTLEKIFALLKPNGIFLGVLPCSNSLSELKYASIKSGCDFHFNELPKINFFEDLKYKKIFFEKILEKQKFSNGIDALKSIKIIGANYSPNLVNTITKAKLKQFNNFCLKNYDSDNKICQISWELAYFAYQKI